MNKSCSIKKKESVVSTGEEEGNGNKVHLKVEASQRVIFLLMSMILILMLVHKTSMIIIYLLVDREDKSGYSEICSCTHGDVCTYDSREQ